MHKPFWSWSLFSSRRPLRRARRGNKRPRGRTLRFEPLQPRQMLTVAVAGLQGEEDGLFATEALVAAEVPEGDVVAELVALPEGSDLPHPDDYVEMGPVRLEEVTSPLLESSDLQFDFAPLAPTFDEADLAQGLALDHTDGGPFLKRDLPLAEAEGPWTGQFLPGRSRIGGNGAITQRYGQDVSAAEGIAADHTDGGPVLKRDLPLAELAIDETPSPDDPGPWSNGAALGASAKRFAFSPFGPSNTAASLERSEVRDATGGEDEGAFEFQPLSGSGSGSATGHVLSSGFVVQPTAAFVPEVIGNYNTTTPISTTTYEYWESQGVYFTAAIETTGTLTIVATAGPGTAWTYDETLITTYTVTTTATDGASSSGSGEYNYSFQASGDADGSTFSFTADGEGDESGSFTNVWGDIWEGGFIDYTWDATYSFEDKIGTPRILRRARPPAQPPGGPTSKRRTAARANTGIPSWEETTSSRGRSKSTAASMRSAA